jgi:hypothetical protein
MPGQIEKRSRVFRGVFAFTSIYERSRREDIMNNGNSIPAFILNLE